MKVKLVRTLPEPQAYGVTGRGRRVVALWADAETVAFRRAAEQRRVEAAVQELADRQAALETRRRRLEELAHRLSGSIGIEKTREPLEAIVARLDAFVQAATAAAEPGGPVMPEGKGAAGAPDASRRGGEGSARGAAGPATGPATGSAVGAFLAGRFYLERAAGRPPDVVGVIEPALATLPLDEETRDFFCDAALACLEAGCLEPARTIAQRFRRAGWTEFRDLVARVEAAT
ncbi:MAG: hypothetical protein OZSIB_1116 [Candidatus Ozemobacter sibiricus]|jgi:hypothetical protein|uniref:Uncharacterized protein n=1 Tax=Candidatus Ozemobacter sibiricus TaxID=2268124 RepID=A0A367ZKZ2_9BACT|nr:MAG: hypothetical protein OZSIB_1116 [Candidatus Ozemobacter sibiricus]